MARKRISEFRAKTLLYKSLHLPYSGVSINVTSSLEPQLDTLDQTKKYVIKVDEGIKKRFKKGLVALDKSILEIPHAIKELQQKGYSRFIIEEFLPYDQSQEKYLALERTRDGNVLYFSEQGGIDIEEHEESVQKFLIPHASQESEKQLNAILKTTHLNKTILAALLNTFDTYYFSFLEINPFLFSQSQFLMLDAAVEVDSVAEFFVNDAWSESDFTDGSTKEKTLEEKNIIALAAKSQAAFSLQVLNPHGSIFMMLSGGGASIVLADEVHNQGRGKELANYGEYSGNPNAEETYIYAKNVLQLLLKSTAPKKVLIIAGGVANFTDVRVTFKGLLKALEEMKEALQKQNVTIFVRRGGPYQEEGLASMKSFLEQEQLLGIVAGPDMVLTDIVTEALKAL